MGKFIFRNGQITKSVSCLEEGILIDAPRIAIGDDDHNTSYIPMITTNTTVQGINARDSKQNLIVPAINVASNSTTYTTYYTTRTQNHTYYEGFVIVEKTSSISLTAQELSVSVNGNCYSLWDRSGYSSTQYNTLFTCYSLGKGTVNNTYFKMCGELGTESETFNATSDREVIYKSNGWYHFGTNFKTTTFINTNFNIALNENWLIVGQTNVRTYYSPIALYNANTKINVSLNFSTYANYSISSSTHSGQWLSDSAQSTTTSAALDHRWVRNNNNGNNYIYRDRDIFWVPNKTRKIATSANRTSVTITLTYHSVLSSYSGYDIGQFFGDYDGIDALPPDILNETSRLSSDSASFGKRYAVATRIKFPKQSRYPGNNGIQSMTIYSGFHFYRSNGVILSEIIKNSVTTAMTASNWFLAQICCNKNESSSPEIVDTRTYQSVTWGISDTIKITNSTNTEISIYGNWLRTRTSPCGYLLIDTVVTSNGTFLIKKASMFNPIYGTSQCYGYIINKPSRVDWAGFTKSTLYKNSKSSKTQIDYIYSEFYTANSYTFNAVSAKTIPLKLD